MSEQTNDRTKKQQKEQNPQQQKKSNRKRNRDRLPRISVIDVIGSVVARYIIPVFIVLRIEYVRRCGGDPLHLCSPIEVRED